MKILELAPYALIKGHNGFEKNRSGLAVVVTDICESLAAANHEVMLLTQSAICKEFEYHNIKIVRKTWCDILSNMKFEYLLNGLRACKQLHSRLIYKAKVMIYFATQGYVETLIQKVKPEIVHIHTIGYYSLPYLFACAKLNVPFVVTLHGMVAFAPKNDVDDKQRLLEKEFCQLADKLHINVIAVSSGVKKRMVDTFKLEGDSFHTIANGVQTRKVVEPQKITALKQKYGISRETVFVCVGSLGERKNQIQIVRAVACMKKEEQKKIKVLILGEGICRTEIEMEIDKNDLEKVVYCCGHIDHEEISLFYSIADYNLVVSKDEGFGLPIAEAFQYGIKTIMFSDLDAVRDVFSPDAVVLVNDRADETLKNAILEACDTTIDQESIMQHAQKFTLNQMAENYLRVFDLAINSHSEIGTDNLRKLL